MIYVQTRRHRLPAIDARKMIRELLNSGINNEEIIKKMSDLGVPQTFIIQQIIESDGDSEGSIRP